MFKSLLLYIFVAFSMLSCDSGDIYTNDSSSNNTSSVNVFATFRFTNIAAFPANYKIALATFKSTSSTPVSKVILWNPQTEDSVLSVSLKDIPSGTSKISLCLLNTQGTDTIYSFYSHTIATTLTTDITLPLQTVNLVAFGRVQSQLFSQCIQCHGGSSTASAGLYLTAGKSYVQLVNHVAKNSTAKNRVTPNSISNSFLYDVLTQQDVVSYNHKDISTLKQDDIQLLSSWILSGANNN